MTTKQDDAAAELLIQEVNDDLRQEQLNALWKRYGALLVAVAVVLVLGVAGWQGWNGWQAKQQQAASLRYADAASLIEAGKSAEAMEALTRLSTDGTPAYALAARFRRADLLQEAGDAAAAAALLETIANDGAVDAVYRNLATLKGAYLDLDTGKAPTLFGKLDALAAETNPWRFSARELLALAAIKSGNTARAAELLKTLSIDAAAPQSIRARAGEMLSTLPTKG